MTTLTELKTELQRRITLAEAHAQGPWSSSQPAENNILQAHFIVSSSLDATYAPVAKCQSRTMNLKQAAANAAFIADSGTHRLKELRALLMFVEELELNLDLSEGGYLVSIGDGVFKDIASNLLTLLK